MALCRKPFVSAFGPHGCGQCLLCRINRRRVWTHRILLEALDHEESTFATLTYSEQALPVGGTIVPQHLRLFIKRVRRYYEREIRYFAVGEYGEESWRPHYHVALFGIAIEPDYAIGSRYEYSRELESLWQDTRSVPPGRGIVHVGEITRESAQYIAGYTIKKLNGRSESDKLALAGRYPERAWMSQGIGRGYIDWLGDEISSSKHGPRAVTRGDVLRSLTHEGKSLPLGRYLQQRLRDRIGLDRDLSKKARVIDAQARELARRKFYVAAGATESEAYDLLLHEKKQRLLNAEARVVRNQKFQRKL